jgi:hypothetical protein
MLCIKAFPCSGGRTRTYDLRVMSPTSYQLLHSALLWYTVLKVADDNEADEYRYALVSSYPSAEAYAASHNQGPEYDAYMDEIQSKYQAIFDTEIYRKVFTIN